MCVYIFISVCVSECGCVCACVCEGRGHHSSHRGTALGEECGGTSLKPPTKEQRCGCVQVRVKCVWVCVHVCDFPLDH